MKRHSIGNLNQEEHLDERDLPFAAVWGLKPIEIGILNISRCFCEGWSNGDVAAWEYAFDFSEERLGPIDGPAFVARVIALMRAILSGRACAFRCLPVGCCHISEDEQVMITVVRNAFRGDNDGLRAAVGQLVTAGSPARTLLTANALYSLCLRYESMQPPETVRMTQPHRALN